MPDSRPQRPALRALGAAFPHTLPILAGFAFLGFAYGLYMSALGFSFLYPTLMALCIYGGSLEFVAAEMLLGPFAPFSALLASLMIQARHLFYGVAMLEKFKGTGKKKPYLIFGMCDETFSVNYSAEIPPDVDRGRFMFFVTLLNQSYWVLSAMLGGIVGDVIPFNTEGLDFVMTAMFVVIFLDEWKKEKQHISALLGLGISALCLALFGATNFMLPTMVCILLVLTALRPALERRESK